YVLILPTLFFLVGEVITHRITGLGDLKNADSITTLRQLYFIRSVLSFHLLVKNTLIWLEGKISARMPWEPVRWQHFFSSMPWDTERTLMPTIIELLFTASLFLTIFYVPKLSVGLSYIVLCLFYVAYDQHTRNDYRILNRKAPREHNTIVIKDSNVLIL